jgi:acetolactate synthase I/II/III large subunit
VRRVREMAPLGTIATVDSGAHMLVVLPLWAVDDRDEVIVSSGLATMGFALPAAIGVATAFPTRRVVCFVGDGGLGMVLAELETVCRLQLPVTIVVFNDSRLSLIAVKQSSTRHGGEGAVTYREVDFAQVAAGFGIPARIVRGDDELDAAVQVTLAVDGPAVLDVRVDPSCYPAVLDAIRGPREPSAPVPVAGGSDG